MDISPYSHRSDEQLAAILDETADWVVDDVGGLIEGCVVHSLREGLHQSEEHTRAGQGVRAVAQLPRGGIIVFDAQMRRMAQLIEDQKPIATNTYEITRIGALCRVAVTMPGYAHPIVRDFSSESSANSWLIQHLSLLNLADLARWLRRGVNPLPPSDPRGVLPAPAAVK
jgi:hypothetical protein